MSGVSITGVEQILGKMAKIDKAFDRKVVKPSMAVALKPIQKIAKSLQKHKSLKKLISRKAFISKKKGVLGKVYLRPSKDRTIIFQGREVGFETVGNILEFGSAKQNIKPQPVMRSARASGSAAARAILKSEIKKRLKQI